MFRSLRFRLPALFLAGATLAGLVSTVIAIGLFQDYTAIGRRRAAARGAGPPSLYVEQARGRSRSPGGLSR